MTKIVRSISLILFICISFHSLQAQDMSNIRVDELSDNQVRQFVKQVESSGLSEDQLEQVAMSKGMSPTEVQILRQRVNKLKSGDPSLVKKVQSPDPQDSMLLFDPRSEKEIQSEAEKALDELKSKIFGASLFKNADPQFEPNLNIATPRNYVIGNGDELMIEIYGYSEASHTLTVSRDGNINIPSAGIVSVAGSTIEEATSRIKSKLSGIYSGLNNGTTQVNVTLSKLRSIKVILTGEIVKPGTYTLPSIATVFNALYSSGGPTENGTLRDIRIIRNGRVISTLDVYDFLTGGSLANNITLQDQDVVFVSSYLNRVELSGQIKRPALFEMKPGETFVDLLGFAGGFTEYAYQDRIKVLKNTGKERRIEDLLNSQFGQYIPESGDKFTISRILERFDNRVRINGAVYRPGDYELSAGLTLSMLIKKADGVKEDAFLNVGYISRLKEDLQAERISFNVANILAGTEPDIVLKREDRVFISSLFDLRDKYNVRIDGEVRSPGSYSYGEGITVKELVLQAGGFTESASPKRVEISRRILNLADSTVTGTTAETFQIDLDRGLEGEAGNFILQPFDLVAIRTSPDYHTQKTVRIEGEVLYPGVYTITSKSERITDLLKRAGGLTEYAYINGASLKRPGQTKLGDQASRTDSVALALENEEKKQQLETLQQLQSEEHSVNINELRRSIENSYVGVNFGNVLKDPNNKQNLLLQDGDIIMIPRELQTVKIGGEVLSPVTAVYKDHHGFNYYISQAGGFSQQALKKRAYIVYANGAAQSTKNFLFFKSYPQVKPGSQIFVPQREERERLSPQALVGLGSAIASMAAIVVSLLR